MIEIGKKFFWGYQNAQTAAHNQAQKYRSLASQTEEQVRALEQQYRQQNAYLFRTASEKMRRAAQVAQATLAQRQARRAANGVTDSSASVMEEAEQTRLSGQMQNSAVQASLQTQGAAQEKTFAQKWQALLQAAHGYRKAAKKQGRFGSIGRAFMSLFQ